MTSMPMWALIVVHCGQNWGYWTLLTEIPTFLSKAIGFNITDVSKKNANYDILMCLIIFSQIYAKKFKCKNTLVIFKS